MGELGDGEAVCFRLISFLSFCLLVGKKFMLSHGVFVCRVREIS